MATLTQKITGRASEMGHHQGIWTFPEKNGLPNHPFEWSIRLQTMHFRVTVPPFVENPHLLVKTFRTRRGWPRLRGAEWSTSNDEQG